MPPCSIIGVTAQNKKGKYLAGSINLLNVGRSELGRGKTFVVTGTLAYFSRVEVKAKIESWAARSSGSLL